MRKSTGTRKINRIAEIQPGCIIRHKTDVELGEAFSDCIVIGLEPEQVWGRASERFKVARPYAFVSNADTMCPSILTGIENVTISFEIMEKCYLIVVNEKDEPRTYIV